MHEIAIIGGGPAGLTAAIEAARNGFGVTLYEKHKIGDNIRCAEGFFDTLNMLGKPKYGVRFKVEDLVLKLRSGYSFPCDAKLNIWMIDRREWQKGLAEEARALGVKIIENSPITRDSYQGITSQYEWVIDSTGVPSLTSLVYKFNKYYTETSALAVQYTMEGDFSSSYGKLILGLEEDCCGYYWIFPKSRSVANVGICYFEKTKRNLWHELDRVVKREGLSSYKISKKLGGLCPVVKLDKLVYANTLLVGDAAGLTSPIHGGGIDAACVSAKIAVQSILNNQVASYESELDSLLGQRLRGEAELCKLWRSFHFDDLDYIFGTIHQAGITLGDCGFFTGEFHMLKKIGPFRFLLSPDRRNFYVSMGKKVLPARAVHRIFRYFVT